MKRKPTKHQIIKAHAKARRDDERRWEARNRGAILAEQQVTPILKELYESTDQDREFLIYGFLHQVENMLEQMEADLATEAHASR